MKPFIRHHACDEAIIDLYNKGVSVERIARHLDCGKGTVSAIANRHGLKRKNKRGNIPEETRQLIRTEFVKGKKVREQRAALAAKYNCSEGAIDRIVYTTKEEDDD